MMRCAHNWSSLGCKSSALANENFASGNVCCSQCNSVGRSFFACAAANSTPGTITIGVRRREAHRAPQRQSWVTQTPNNHDAQYAWTRACELTRLTPRIRVHHLGHGNRLRRPFVKAQILGAHRGCDGLCTIESHRALFSIKDERTHAKFSETFSSSKRVLPRIMTLLCIG